MAATDVDTDPHKFLEEVLSDKSMDWVKQQNSDCITKYGDPTTTKDYRRLLDILDSKDKIPSVAQIGSSDDGMYYNFWQDEKHVQGIWRKTTLESYKTKSPHWETVLDLDALEAPKTDTAGTWVWHGSTLLDEGPMNEVKDRALIKLSPGGSDADIFREFDLLKQEFIDPDEASGGFELLLPTKCRVSYRSRNELLIGTDFEQIDPSVTDSLTDSGYPRTVYSWKRGTPLKDAKIVFDKAEQADIAGNQYAYHDRDGICHEFQSRSITFYTSEYWYRSLSLDELMTKTADDHTLPEFQKVPIPDDADIGTYGNEAMITLRSDWSPPGYKKGGKEDDDDDNLLLAGSLLVVTMQDVMKNDYSKSTCLFEPTPSKSLSSTTTTKDYVILEALEDVRTSLIIWKKDGEKWSLQEAPKDGASVPIGEGVGFSNPNRDSSSDNRLFVWKDGFLVPQTLEYIEDVADLLTTKDTAVKLKSKPSEFDSSELTVDQNFATSKDGTKIPYFVIRKKDIPLDGTNPTLVDAYGGFEISRLPGYSAAVGSCWLESGGIKVIANIRGGGEYGPKWHQAALKANRYKCYEDMEAVAQDLIDRKITTPEKMACIGGSNGGLMVGNLITRPLSSKLFGAAVCQVPLLDMKRYSHLLAGASWMAEYGNPDTDDWKFLRNHSPYHMLRHDNLGLPEEGKENTEIKNPDWVCPKVLFTTSTRDDRVHPGHARKMVRSLLEEAQTLGKAPEVFYWENIEGGHGGAADNKQRAHMWALTYSMLKQTLGL